MKKLLLSAFSLCASASLFAVTVVDYDFSDGYISAFTAFTSGSSFAQGFGGGNNFDGVNGGDSTRYTTFSNPTANNYLTTGGGTQAGYAFTGSTTQANLSPTPGVNQNTVPNGNNYVTGEFAVTGASAIRLRPVGATQGSNTPTTNMGTATWLTFGNSTWDALGGPGDNAGFDGTSNLSASVSNFGDQTFRFLVLADGNYYVSDFTASGLNPTLNIANPSAATFYTYSNAGAADGLILFDQSAETSVTGSSLSNMTAVGLYSDKLNFDGTAFTSDADMDWNLTGFTANLAAIPEPGTYSLIAGFMVLGWIMVRRRK